MLILGMDVGGTLARCLVADLEGRRLGIGQAGGGNPTSHGLPAAMGQIRAALEQALREVDRSAIAASVAGVAGFADWVEAHAAFDAMWSDLDLADPPQLTYDTLVAFAAGTPAAAGTVIVSGTGAVAAEIVDGEQVLLADGNGWLLGDDGSGFWVGREAVRHTLRPTGASPPDDPLATAVLRHVLGRVGTRRELLRVVYAGPPVALAGLARVVGEAADGGDPDARRILSRAADRLEESSETVRSPGADTPIVLSGGMFAARHLMEPLLQRLRARWPHAPICRATNGAGGAAWLAARSLEVPLPATLHAALTTADGRTH